MEEDLHCAGVGHDDWRLEVTGGSARNRGLAAALVHQDFPVPICDLEMVAITVATVPNSKSGELKPQYFPTLHLNRLCLCDVVRVLLGVVWRGDNTCGWLAVYQVDFKKGTNCFTLSLHHSPSLPQPLVGQSIVCFGCQSPDPLVESGAQVMSMSHWPQQQLPASPW